MAAIRTLSDLQQEMAADFAWRKKELHHVKSLVVGSDRNRNQEMAIRAAVTLLYAHWEGFVKRIGTCYLEFVANRRLTHDGLTSNFLAMEIGRRLRDAASTGRLDKCLEIVELFRSSSSSRSNLQWKSAVNTKSNLNSSVFKEIIATLGLDYSEFSTKEKLLDEKLLNHRNHIAHGQYLLVSAEEYMELHSELLAMMQGFYDQVENAAFTGAFERTSQPSGVSMAIHVQ